MYFGMTGRHTVATHAPTTAAAEQHPGDDTVTLAQPPSRA